MEIAEESTTNSEKKGNSGRRSFFLTVFLLFTSWLVYNTWYACNDTAQERKRTDSIVQQSGAASKSKSEICSSLEPSHEANPVQSTATAHNSNSVFMKVGRGLCKLWKPLYDRELAFVKDFAERKKIRAAIDNGEGLRAVGLVFGLF